MDKISDIQFSKKDVQMARKYKKKCSTSLINREIQIETTLGFHIIRVKKTIMKKTNNSQC
jgi:hypothetical protein